MRLQTGEVRKGNGCEVISHSFKTPGDSSTCESSYQTEFSFELKSELGKTWNQHRKTGHHEELIDCGEAFPGQNLLKSSLPSADERGVQRKVSELRVALDASNRAREESEKETESLRMYLSHVESGASSLHSRVQDLEQQLRFAKAEGDKQPEELQSNMVRDARLEAQKQAAAAAQAVIVAREAAMELDKVKRHYSAVVKSQEEEIIRLCKDLDNTRVLYQAKSGLAEPLKQRIRDLESSLDMQSKTVKEDKCVQIETDVSSGSIMYHRIKALESENLDLMVRNGVLEERVIELQRRQIIATIAHYDFELHKVRAVLGGEKAHLLSELALLRSRNKCLRGNLAEWYDKYMALGLELESDSKVHSTVDDAYGLNDSQLFDGGESKDAAIELDTCIKDNSKESILAAAHREIMKLNEINQWLLSACQNDIRLKKISKLL